MEFKMEEQLEILIPRFCIFKLQWRLNDFTVCMYAPKGESLTKQEIHFTHLIISLRIVF